jgi:hypothetical protein
MNWDAIGAIAETLGAVGVAVKMGVKMDGEQGILQPLPLS